MARRSDYVKNDGTRATFVYRDDDILDKPLDLRQLRRLLGFVGPHKGLALASVALTLLTTSLRLVTPYLMGLTIDRGLGGRDAAFMTTLLMLLLALYLTMWAANTIRISLVNRLGQSVLTDLRSKLFSHVQNLSLDFFDRRPAGSILVRITNDVDSLQELFTSGIITLMVDLVAVVAIAVIIFTIDPKLALVSMSVVPVMILVSTKLRRQISACWDWVRTTRTRINVHLNEALQGMKVTQAYVREDVNQEFFGTINGDHRLSWNKGSMVADCFGPAIEFTGAVGTCMVYWYGAVLVGRGELTVGLLVSFAQYLGNFWEPISRLGGVYNQMLQAMASSDRIFELLDTSAAVQDPPNPRPRQQMAGEIDFSSVSFSYTKDRPALVGVDLHIRPGQMVALVGHTGSGKTTIANLVQRSYDVSSGQILIDGVDIREYRLEDLRSQIGVVLQDTFLFSGTISDNIRFGKLSATDTEIQDAARAVMADDFIQRMPEGYETAVYERGSGVSMGQRQLVSFARAILADPRILILDEATASIDTATEALIQQALARVLAGRTSIVVAHRLSTIRQADLIVVLDHGRIVETGSHDELMAGRGTYFNLIRAQYEEGARALPGAAS